MAKVSRYILSRWCLKGAAHQKGGYPWDIPGHVLLLMLCDLLTGIRLTCCETHEQPSLLSR